MLLRSGASEGQDRARCRKDPVLPLAPHVSVGAMWQEINALSEGDSFVSEGWTLAGQVPCLGSDPHRPEGGALCPCATSWRPAASATWPFRSLHRRPRG